MDKFTQPLSLDINNLDEKYKCVPAKQGDNATRYLKITLMNGTAKITPSSSDKAVFRCVKPDGHCCVNDETINSDGTITVELTDQILACRGLVKADVSLVNGSSVLSSAMFYIDADPAATSSNTAKSSNEFNSLNNAIEKANKALEGAEKAKEAADKSASAADTAASAANKATKSAQNLIDDVIKKLENGDFDGKDGDPYELTDEDIQKIKNAALSEVTEAAKNADDAAKKADNAAKKTNELIDDITKKLKNGDFKGEKGDSYILTSFDKTEIAEEAATLVGAMQGGTVTYKIPKEDYQTDFGDDPNSAGSVMITINFGKVVINQKQFMEDKEAGIVELLPYGRSLTAEEEEIYKKYVSFDIKPWMPTPRVSLFDFVTTEILELRDNYEGRSTLFLNKIWNNDFKVSIHAENANGEMSYGCVKSDAIHYEDFSTALSAGLIPYFGYTLENDEETGISTLNLALTAVGASMGYGSTLGSYTSYVTNDDVKAVTITFIPNNAVVEEYEDE